MTSTRTVIVANYGTYLRAADPDCRHCGGDGFVYTIEDCGTGRTSCGCSYIVARPANVIVREEPDWIDAEIARRDRADSIAAAEAKMHREGGR